MKVAYYVSSTVLAILSILTKECARFGYRFSVWCDRASYKLGDRAHVAALIGVGEGFSKHGWGASFNTGTKSETREEFEARRK